MSSLKMAADVPLSRPVAGWMNDAALGIARRMFVSPTERRFS